MKNVKKISVIAVMLFAVMTSWGQTNLFDELNKYKNEKFKSYEIKSYKGEIVFVDQEKWLNVRTTEDKYGKGIGVSVSVGDEYKNSYTDHEFSPRWDRIDHYTEPSYCRSSNNEEAFVMIEGVLYQLNSTNEDLTEFQATYTMMYIPKSIIDAPVPEEKKEEPKEEEGKGKKKGMFKKLKAKLEEAMATPPPAPYFAKINSFELFDQHVSKYLADMKKKQAAATLNAQEKQGWKDVLGMKQKAIDEVTAYNNAYFKTEAGQRQMKQRLAAVENRNNACKFTVKNVGSQSVAYTTDRSVFRISPGQSQSFDCSVKVYRSNSNGDKLSVIGGGSSSYSGKTITVQ